MVRAKEIAVLAILAGFGSLAFTCGEKQHKPSEEEAHVTETTDKSDIPKWEEVVDMTDTDSQFSALSDGTRKTLVIACGRCHQSTLATHKPGAIAIFDLDKGENWHDKLTVKTLESLSKRIQNNTAFSDEERAVIKKFVVLKQVKLE